MLKKLALGILLSLTSLQAEITQQQLQKVDETVQQFAKKEKNGGIAVAIIIPDSSKGYRRLTYCYGHAKGPDSPPPKENSIFYLASVTKVFTATVLAKFVAEGKVSLDDPAQKFVPADVKVPSYNGKQMTLRDLATHTSGLPRDVTGIKHPYHFEVSEFYEWLSHTKLRSAPGTKDLYSNVGFGFLGLILGNVAHTTYEQAVIDNLCNPLNMSDSRMIDSYSDEQKERFCHYYDKKGKPTPTKCCAAMPAIAGGGAFASTLNDMSRFLVYNMGLLDSSMNKYLPLLQKHAFTNSKNHFIGLGWYDNPLFPSGSLMKFSKNGGMKGVSTYIAFVKESKTGVVALANCNSESTTTLGNDILKILNSK